MNVNQEQTALMGLMIVAIVVTVIATSVYLIFPPEPRCAPWKTPVIVNGTEVVCVEKRK